VADPTQWHFLLRIPQMWRVMFPIPPEVSDADATSRTFAQRALEGVVPGGTGHEIVHLTLYRVHQRVATAFRAGRVFLAGDAAHVNNPLGGMGMNGGIHDAINLSEKLAAVLHGADVSLLGRYERQRRKVAIEAVQAQALRNRQILRTRDPAERQAYYDELKATADNPVRHKNYLMRSSLIQSLREAAATP